MRSTNFAAASAGGCDGRLPERDQLGSREALTIRRARPRGVNGPQTEPCCRRPKRVGTGFNAPTGANAAVDNQISSSRMTTDVPRRSYVQIIAAIGAAFPLGGRHRDLCLACSLMTASATADGKIGCPTVR